MLLLLLLQVMLLPLLVLKVLKDLVESVAEVSLHRLSNTPSQWQHLLSLLQLHSFAVQLLQKRKLTPPKFKYFVEENFGFDGFFVLYGAVLSDGPADCV